MSNVWAFPPEVNRQADFIKHIVIENIRLRDENAQLKAEIDDLKEKNRWIPVSERQPESNRRVIFISLEGTVYCGMHQSSVPQWVADGCYFHSSWYKFVTHWMPLPEPPQEVEE